TATGRVWQARETWTPTGTRSRAPSRAGGRPRRGAGLRQSDAARRAIADLRFAAWFLWMTPLEAALSSLRAAAAARDLAFSASPDSAASRKLRIAVFRPVFTD